MNFTRKLLPIAVVASLAACSKQPPPPAAEVMPNTPVMAPPSTAPMAAAAPLPAGTPVTPGGNIEQAAAASVGTAIAGEIARPDQNDYYRFDVHLSQRDLAVVRLENQSSTLKPDFKLFSAERSQLGEYYDGTPGASAQTTLALEPGQTIYVGVINNGSVGKYTLSVAPQLAFDSNEPNDDILTAKAIAFGTPIEGNAMDDKDFDWFRITGVTQKTVHLVFENLSTTLKPDLKMFSSTKSQTGEKYDGTPGANLDFTFDVEPGKDFYLQVLPYGTTGKYKLTLTAEAPAPATAP